METKFTKRSQNDNTLVTVQLTELDLVKFDLPHRVGNVGDNIIVTIENVPTVFRLARPDKHGRPTAAVSHGFPRKLSLPAVGAPVYAKVTDVCL